MNVEELDSRVAAMRSYLTTLRQCVEEAPSQAAHLLEEVSAEFEACVNVLTASEKGLDEKLCRRAEETLREQERFIHQIAELSPVLLDVFDYVTERNPYISRHAINLHGYTPEEVAQMKDPLSELLHPEDVPRMRERLERLKQMADGEIDEIEYRMRGRDGEWRWMVTRNMPFARNEQGEVRQVIGATFDITERKLTEEALRESEHRYRQLIHPLPAAIYTCDARGYITLYNDAAVALWGREPEIGNDMWCGSWRLYVPDGSPLPFDQCPMAVALREGRPIREKEIVVERPDGTRSYVLPYAVPIRDASGEVVGAVNMLVDITERKLAEEELRNAHDELERRVWERTAALTEVNTALQEEIRERSRIEGERVQLLRRLITAQEEERYRIAGELHDQMGQYLAALMLGIKSLKDGSQSASHLDSGITKLQEVITECAQEVRRLALELRPMALDDLGLYAALSNYVEQWSERSGIVVDFHSNGLLDQRLPPHIETSLYRVIQEALNNVLKHARARHVSLVLEYRQGRLLAILEDDGCGFNVEEALNAPIAERGLGLTGMRERIESAGGKLDIESSPEAGTTLVARIPVAHAEGIEND